MGWGCRNCGFEACEDREQCAQDSKLEIDRIIKTSARMEREGKHIAVTGPSVPDEAVVDLGVAAGKLLAEWLP